MNVFLAGMTLALATQAAEPYRYNSIAAPNEVATPDLAPPPSANNEQPSADAGQPSGQSASPAGQAVPPAGTPDVAQPNSVPLQLETAPVGGAQPDPAAPQRSVLAPFVKPTDLMRQFMKPPASGQLSGTPITLGDAVGDARTRQEQTVRAKAYWDLAASVADYHLAVLEDLEVGALRQGISAPAKQWDERLKQARARVAVAQRAAGSAQLRLHQLLDGASGAALPLPADIPHCGRYNAEYEEIFGDRPDPIARQLSELMPLRYSGLRSQAQAIADAQAWRDEMSRRRDPAGDGLDLLQAQDLLSLQRRTFVATARDYNLEIAEYTELAAPSDVPADRLVAMMIRTAATDDSLPWQPSGVQQAAAEEPASDSPPASTGGANPSGDAGLSRTFENGGYREVRRPLQRLLDRQREHSILRRPIQRLRERIN